ncbi:MAG: hypothetical protein E5Y55_24375 [Mesorhizobium sp.]|uniref:leucine zipper domain-containing protein n=1 Tax=Mesorhizobium sp. TaxID=1871066 RepID=UPI001210D2C2|nr:leucine zipper domain-containing protein [Mesorhizobium sp.]TIM41524.1 MAG: hypothetical protein E5Y55_24375 [Mesorhizobium sp.]
MNIHKNARLTPLGRERIVRQVESGHTPEAVAEAAGVWPRTVRKWVDRYRREGSPGLQDRSSRPHRLRRPTPGPIIDTIERLRREKCSGGGLRRNPRLLPNTRRAGRPDHPNHADATGLAEDYDPPSIHRINAGCTRATDTGSKEPPFRSGLADLLGSASWNPSSRNRTARPTARR